LFSSLLGFFDWLLFIIFVFLLFLVGFLFSGFLLNSSSKFVLELFETIHSDFGSRGYACGELVGSSSESSLASSALPDASSDSSDGRLNNL